MKYLQSFITVILLAPSLSYATTIPDNFPHDLLYQNKPIDALCFSDSREIVNLAACGIHTQPDYVMTRRNSNLLKKGFVGYDYSYHLKNDTLTNQFNGYSYYKPFASNSNHTNIIYVMNSGGGSGQFSALYSTIRIKNTLYLKSLAGGDRCNSGVFDVSQKKETLTYHVNLTSYDFLPLANNNPDHLKAYDDLEACAACCRGVAVFEHDLNHPKQEKLVSVDLANYPIDPKNPPQQGQYQACFNQVLMSAPYLNKKSLTPDELKQFTHIFNARCVK